LKGIPKYKSQSRNNYGAVDYFEGVSCRSNVMAGIKPQYLADEIEGHLNDAVSKGSEFIKEKARLCFVRNHHLDSIIDCLVEETIITKEGIKHE